MAAMTAVRAWSLLSMQLRALHVWGPSLGMSFPFGTALPEHHNLQQQWVVSSLHVGS
jgi:hypothetical protein